MSFEGHDSRDSFCKKPRIIRNNRGGGGGDSTRWRFKISKLLRRSTAEREVAAVIDIYRKLKFTLADSSNANYLRRSFDILVDNVISVFETVPKAAKVFGLMR